MSCSDSLCPVAGHCVLVLFSLFYAQVSPYVMSTAFQEGPVSDVRRLNVGSDGESSSEINPPMNGEGGEKQEPSF